MDEYFRGDRIALDVTRRETAAWVVVEASGAIVGYYTLSAASVSRQELTSATRRQLGYRSTPATLLGRLALRRDLHSNKVNSTDLIQRALARCVRTSKYVASAVVVVDAIDERACAFYGKAGFKAFPVRRQEPEGPEAPAIAPTTIKMWLPMAAAEKALLGAGLA